MSMVSTAFKDWGASLLNAFYDENGEFTLSGGVRNLASEFGKIALAISAFGLLLAPRLFFGTLWQVGAGGAGLALSLIHI